MMDNIDEVTGTRLEALREIEKDNIQILTAYNKKVKVKVFKSVIWFEKQLCLQEQRATSLANDPQVEKKSDFFFFLGILI